MDKFVVILFADIGDVYIRYFECDYDTLLKEIIGDPKYRDYLFSNLWCGYEVDSEKEKCQRQYPDGDNNLIEILKEHLKKKYFTEYLKIYNLNDLKNGIILDAG